MMAPVCVIPVPLPAAKFIAVTAMLPPPELMVIAPKETIVEATPPVALILNIFAVIRPVVEITVAEAVDVD